MYSFIFFPNLIKSRLTLTDLGVKEIRALKKIMKKTDGEFFLFSGEVKELKSLSNHTLGNLIPPSNPI